MAYDKEMYEQDLKAAQAALEAEEFELLNIFANRIMANASIFNDSNFSLPGFFVKDIASMLSFLKERRSPAPMATAKTIATTYVKSLAVKTTGGSFSSKTLWKDYVDFCNKIRENLLNDQERESYTKEMPDFSHSAFENLLKFLDTNKLLLCNKKCRLLKGIINEMSRLYTANGIHLIDLLSYSLIVSLDRCYEYVVTTSDSPEELSKRVEQEILLYIPKILEAVKGKTEPESTEKVDDLLWELIDRWRKYFIKYMDIPRVLRIEEKPEVALPEDVKKRLTEAVAKALEKETK